MIHMYSIESESIYSIMTSKPFRPRKDPRPAMEQALERAITLSAGTKQYTITDGRLVYEQHRRYRYAFTLESSWDLPDGTDFQLKSSDFDRLPVELSNTKDDRVTITTIQRLPERTLSSAHLVIERAYLLRKMKEALTHVSTSANLGLKLFGHLESVDGTAASSLVDLMSDVFVPDDAQRLAIQRSLASEVQVILGPGGTGKTDVLSASAMLHTLLSTRRVLITSHTNIAIDNAIIRLAAFFHMHGMDSFLEEQKLVRAGHPHLAELETDAYRNITIFQIVNDVIEQQREEIAHLERRCETVIHEITAHQEEVPRQVRAWEQRKAMIPFQRKRARADLNHLEEEELRRGAHILAQLSPLQERDHQMVQIMKQAETSRKADEALLKPLQEEYTRRWSLYEKVLNKLERFQEHWSVARFFVQFFTGKREKALNELTGQMAPLQKRLATTQQTYEQATQQHKDLELRIASWIKERDARPASYLQEKATYTCELAELERELQAGTSRIALLEQALVEARQERDRIEERLAHLDQQVEDAKREAAHKVLASAQIVGTTLTSLYLNPTLLHQQWDVVIIDEGSMAPPPAVMIAAQLAGASVIVVGDPLQLAPVCRFQDTLVKRWLGCDVFYHGGYTLQEAGTGSHHSILLPYQIRMHPDICDLVRDVIYQGLLKDRSPHLPRPKFEPEPDCAVVLYDTGGMPQARARKPESGRSRYNSFHAEIAVKLAELALADMPNKKPECIGIVTPYTEQRDRIKELVRETALETYARIGTVHAFQSLEFDVLIFDTVESPEVTISRFTSDRWGTNAMRLLNVAVTRARYKLLIVANMPYIRQQPASSILVQMMELACQKKCVSGEALSKMV